jgi:hypothetical protein
MKDVLFVLKWPTFLPKSMMTSSLKESVMWLSHDLVLCIRKHSYTGFFMLMVEFREWCVYVSIACDHVSMFLVRSSHIASCRQPQ